jgi:hypothetical protein
VGAPEVLMPQHGAAPHLAATQFPATGQLLVEGGDARIALNQAGRNKYGCIPHPDKNIAAFGSATATSISEASYFAADQLRTRLAHLVTLDAPEIVYADEMQRIRRELIEVCGLGNLPGLDIVFSTSGTDCHLIAAQLARNERQSAVRILMVAEAETGSGVPAALSVQHEGIVIPIRLPDGTPRASADIDADFEQQVAAAAAIGQRVLLTMVDVSKTGLIAPSVACALDLHQRFPDTVEVLVDACQFRIALPTLHVYLAQGFMVAMTGSKFISGPSFSGALLIPASSAKKYRAQSLGDNLRAHSSRGDWPRDWSPAKQLDDAPNFGLLLRWQAALTEMREFHSASNAVVRDFLQAFAGAIAQRLDGDPNFAPLAVPELQRHACSDPSSWDSIQTIFPFLLFHSGSEKIPLSREETAQVYLALQEETLGNERVQLAQPVVCGERDGVAVSALRLCVSSRLVVAAVQQNAGNQQAVIQRALRALDQVARLVHTLNKPPV